MYGADSARSHTTSESLDFPLTKIWEYTPTQAPCPAWQEPGKELHRIDFDYAPQPVIAKGIVYFGSSADDTLRAVDLTTGAPKWSFTAGGPIRFAPAISNDKAYFACDDGYLYCLNANTGTVLWKFHGAPADDLMLGNGRMISRWPLRSGLTIKNNIIYFTAGMWPAQGIFLYALSADTGKELWRNDSSGNMHINLPHNGAAAFTGVAPQGYILVSNNTILVPTGRSVPAAYNIKTGKLRYYFPAKNKRNGGAWTSSTKGYFFNPSHTSSHDLEARIGEAKPRPGDGMCIYELSSGKNLLKIPDKLHSITANGIMYAVGAKKLDAIDMQGVSDPKNLEKYIKWSATRKSRSYSLIGTAQSIIVGGSDSITATDKDNGKRLWETYINGQARGLAVSKGRLVTATEKGIITCFGSTPIKIPAIPVRNQLTWNLGIDDSHAQFAAQIISKTGIREGYAIVIGQPDANLATAIAMQSKLHVISILKNADLVKTERQRLATTDLYGSRVTVHELINSRELPFAPYFASLVVVSEDTKISGLYRILRPYGGTLCLPDVRGSIMRRFMRKEGAARSEFQSAGKLQTIVRGALPNSGEWRQQWADSGNSGIGQERGVQPPFDILWFGGPGPDRMMDRHWRTASPLFVGGRVFLTGQHHVIAFNAYDGRELWSKQIQETARRHVPYYASNFFADDTSIYLAVGPLCYRLDQKTGHTLTVYHLPNKLKQESEALSATDHPHHIAIPWPEEWSVLGPFPGDQPVLSKANLASIPKNTRSLACVDGILDFTCLYGGYGFKPLAAGAKLDTYRGRGTRQNKSANRTAYAFTTINVATNGLLTIGAGSDWKMQWFLDGAPIFNTLKRGNKFYPPAIRNHVFSVPVTKGSHVLAVMVRSSSRGWSLISAGGREYLPHTKFLRQYEERPVWGYLAASDNLVFGTYVGPGLAKTDSSALFALDKRKGSVHWIKRAARSFSSDAIAFKDNKIFVLDTTSRHRVQLAGWKNEKIQTEQSLMVLNLKTGRELWRQDDVPPRQYRVQYTDGIVTINANAGYKAATGKKLWQKYNKPLKPPVIRGNTIIAQPYAYNLQTGSQIRTRHPVTGENLPWLLSRSYGCGLIAGCETFLCFRSAAAGVYDFAQEGTTTFGGIRPGCAVNMIPAGGLLIIPEASSGCSCSYNIQTSLALISSSRQNDTWYIFSASESAEPVKHLRINFGAPGDRRDKQANAWLGYPRPNIPKACPLPISINTTNIVNYTSRSQRYHVDKTDQSWLCRSEVRNPGIIKVFTRPSVPMMQICETSPVLDGALDDKCWKTAQPILFPNNINLKEPATTLIICRDSINVYIGYNRKPVIRNGKPLPLKIKKKKNEPSYREDCFMAVISDNKLQDSIYFELTCSGAHSLSHHNLQTDKIDRKWQGKWTQSVKKGTGSWSAEVAIPISTLLQAGIDPDTLRINFKSRNQAKEGVHMFVLRNPAPTGFPRTTTLAPVLTSADKSAEHSYDITLYFAEPDHNIPGARIFDVKIQDKSVLKDFDIFKEAGGQHRPLIKKFRKIKAGSVLTIELIPKSKHNPILNALEILRK
ncbi:MAG: PQQ-binding-like beta-propeller repeat protein [Kiritimatiellae bacterium]|nr:PQQ-binding-like beta-propeller repeat protein [Kiritimatiellia bacterium]